MSAKLVPAVRTQYNQSQMIEGFVKGWIKQFNEIPKKESIGVIFSQNSLETGSTKSMWNNNVGNYKYVPSKDPEADADKQYMMLDNVWEIINGQKVIFSPPSPVTWFKAFPTLEEGIAFYLNSLKTGRFSSAWSAVESGNPSAFAHLLKLKYYYSAPEKDYVTAMNSYFNKYMKDPTFDNVVANLQPNISVDPETNNVTVTGDLDFVPKPSSNIWDNIVNIFKK